MDSHEANADETEQYIAELEHLLRRGHHMIGVMAACEDWEALDWCQEYVEWGRRCMQEGKRCGL